MKKIILIQTVIFWFLISCGTRNTTTLTDQEKELIKSELVPIMNQIIQNSEAGNLEKATEYYSNKPEFMSISNGQVSDYNQFIAGNKAYFEALETQKFSESSMTYTFINKDIVIVTWGGSALAKLKDGQQIKVDPFAASLIFNKTGSTWKVIYNHESGAFAPVANDSLLPHV